MQKESRLARVGNHSEMALLATGGRNARTVALLTVAKRP